MANFGYFFVFVFGLGLGALGGWWWGKRGKEMMQRQLKDFEKELLEDAEKLKDKVLEKLRG